jgi:hypothetical protein
MWVFRHFWGFLGLFRGFLGVGTAGGGFWGGTNRCRFRHKYGFLGSVRKNIGVRIGIFLFFGV